MSNNVSVGTPLPAANSADAPGSAGDAGAFAESATVQPAARGAHPESAPQTAPRREPPPGEREAAEHDRAEDDEARLRGGAAVTPPLSVAPEGSA